MMPVIALYQGLDLSASKANQCSAYSSAVKELDGEVCVKAATATDRTFTRTGRERSRISEDGPDPCLVFSVERTRSLIEKGAKNFAHGLGGQLLRQRERFECRVWQSLEYVQTVCAFNRAEKATGWRSLSDHWSKCESIAQMFLRRCGGVHES